MPSGVQTCALDRKSTRLNSSHGSISYAVFCLKKTTTKKVLVIILTILELFPYPTLLGRKPATFCAWWRAQLTRQGWRLLLNCWFCFFNDTATTEIHPLSQHGALRI